MAARAPRVSSLRPPLRAPERGVPLPQGRMDTRLALPTQGSNGPRNHQVIVGANGAGKSTILKLTTRLYDPDEGEILVGGHDIRTLKLDDLLCLCT